MNIISNVFALFLNITSYSLIIVIIIFCQFSKYFIFGVNVFEIFKLNLYI